MGYKPKQVNDMLNSLQHIIGSFQCGIKLFKASEEVSEQLLLSMQEIVNADFKRLRNGELPITAAIHLKTRGKI